MTAYTNSNFNEVTTTLYHDCIKNFLDDDNQNQNNFSDLKRLIIESSDINYDNMSPPVPIVTTVGVSDAIPNSLISMYGEYEDNLIQEEYDAYGGGSAFNW